MRYAINLCTCFILNPILGISSGKHVKHNSLTSKVIGGTLVPIDQYPSSIQFFNLGNFCAGTILNSWTMLTAAHCFDLNQNVQDMMVHVGTTHLYDHHAKVHDVHSIVIHEDYNKPIPFACDIALIFLEAPIQFNEKTKKGIIANTSKWMKEGENNFEVTGWGWTKYGGPVSKNGLMMAVLKYVPLKKCSKIHNLELSPDMFCLYGDGLKDSCRGDSGGSVLWNKMVVGIISHGDGCAKEGKPSMYTNVLYFRDWIEAQVKKFISTYCTRVK